MVLFGTFTIYAVSSLMISISLEPLSFSLSTIEFIFPLRSSRHHSRTLRTTGCPGLPDKPAVRRLEHASESRRRRLEFLHEPGGEGIFPSCKIRASISDRRRNLARHRVRTSARRQRERTERHTVLQLLTRLLREGAQRTLQDAVGRDFMNHN